MSTDGDVSQATRRRSERLSGAERNKASPVAVVKHSIVLKKIEPERRLLKRVSGEAAHSPRDAQTKALRRSPRTCNQSVKENVDVCEAEPVTGVTGPGRGGVTGLGGAERGHLSPVSLNSPDPRGLPVSQKVRRSYSRLSPTLTALGSAHTSTPAPAPEKRCSLFGFERLLWGEVEPSGGQEEVGGLGAISPVKPPSAPAPPNSPDGNIPGIAIGKEKRRRRKVPQIQVSEMEEWAAQMNATFEEAERFPLLVE